MSEQCKFRHTQRKVVVSSHVLIEGQIKLSRQTLTLLAYFSSDFTADLSMCHRVPLDDELTPVTELRLLSSVGREKSCIGFWRT